MKAYIFKDEDNAVKFFNAANHLGYKAERIGNAVLAENGVLKAVTDAYTVYEEEAPVWTNEEV